MTIQLQTIQTILKTKNLKLKTKKYMKSLKSIILCGLGVLALSLTSCNDWLDVNVDPNNPTDKITSYDQRLAHIEFYTNSGLQFGAWRTTMAMGDWTRNNGGGNYWHVSYWRLSRIGSLPVPAT